MTKSFATQATYYFKATAKYLLFAINLCLLSLLGFKIARVWTSKTFDFFETIDSYPLEPEFVNKVAAEKQLWMGLGFETFVFIIGAFLCYEFLIKNKSVRLGLIAPFVTLFLFLTGESVQMFLPSLDKAREIKTCLSVGISWNKKTHRCNYMDLEKQRLERFLAQKKLRQKQQIVRMKKLVKKRTKSIKAAKASKQIIATKNIKSAKTAKTAKLAKSAKTANVAPNVSNKQITKVAKPIKAVQNKIEASANQKIKTNQKKKHVNQSHKNIGQNEKQLKINNSKLKKTVVKAKNEKVKHTALKRAKKTSKIVNNRKKMSPTKKKTNVQKKKPVSQLNNHRVK